LKVKAKLSTCLIKYRKYGRLALLSNFTKVPCSRMGQEQDFFVVYFIHIQQMPEQCLKLGQNRYMRVYFSPLSPNHHQIWRCKIWGTDTVAEKARIEEFKVQCSGDVWFGRIIAPQIL